MIDTLKIRLSDFAVNSGADLKIQHPTTDFGSGECGAVYPLFSVNGSTVTGSKAFHNAEDFNVTIQNVAKHTPDSVECFVQFSAPKIANGDNFALADAPTTVKACDEIERRLSGIGIKTNVRNAAISRLDAAKNIQCSEPTPSYFPVLGMLQGKRMAKRDYGTTYLWGNKSHEICAYDKVTEMVSRKVSTETIDPHTLRIEWRLLKAAKFQDATSMRTVKDVLGDYGHLEQCYRDAMAKQLFSASVPAFERLRASDIERELKLFQERGDACWWRAWVMATALKGVLVDFDTVVNAAVKVSTNRSQPSRIRRDFQSWKMDAMALIESENPNRQNLSQLYGELKDKTLAR
jgi:hypothetical protein